MKIETYNLKARNGNIIRKASMVTLASGLVIKFWEKYTKTQIIRFIEAQQWKAYAVKISDASEQREEAKQLGLNQ